MTSDFLYTTRLERLNSRTVLESHSDACWLYSVLLICITSQVRLSTAPALIWRVAALGYLAYGRITLRVRLGLERVLVERVWYYLIFQTRSTPKSGAVRLLVLYRNHAGAAYFGYRENVSTVGANEANLGNSNLFISISL